MPRIFNCGYMVISANDIGISTVEKYDENETTSDSRMNDTSDTVSVT